MLRRELRHRLSLRSAWWLCSLVWPWHCSLRNALGLSLMLLRRLLRLLPRTLHLLRTRSCLLAGHRPLRARLRRTRLATIGRLLRPLRLLLRCVGESCRRGLQWCLCCRSLGPSLFLLG